jgi:hypothetical protein
MTSDLNKLRDQYHQSVAAFIQGDPGVQKPLWSRRDDVTLANPRAPGEGLRESTRTTAGWSRRFGRPALAHRTILLFASAFP